MSSYDDPSWYEQPEQHNINQPPARQPAYEDFGPPPPLPGAGYFVPTQPPNKRNRRGRVFGQLVLTTALLIIAFLGGWFSNQALFNSFTASSQSDYYSHLIQQGWSIVDQHYVDRKAVDYKQMSYQAIRAMLDVLGDKGHTRFLTPADVQAENQSLSGKFTGIGIYLRQDKVTKQLIIISPISGSPAEKAGFKHGDIIIAVNGTSTVGKDIDGVSKLIQGKAGTSVSITVQRPSTHQTLTITVTRAEINVPNVLMHYIASDHIAHIQITQFADGASSQLKDALMQAQKLGAKSIILDLRDDPGGILDEAINTASEFMASGTVLLEQDSTGQRQSYNVNGNPVNTTSPIVVLVNNGTASAAEIVSGSLQDNNRAVIIGERTFGTGTVLYPFPLADGSAILLGTQEWLTPKGRFIRDKGITPNINVTLGTNATPLEPNDENAGNLTEQQILSSGDTQLAAGIHYLEAHYPAKLSASPAGGQPAQGPPVKYPPLGQLAWESPLWDPNYRNAAPMEA